MNEQRISQLHEVYRQQLFDKVVPFWLKYSLDHEFGGQFNSIDQDGSIFDTDKSMWLQGRAVWMFSKLYNEVEQRPEWLEAAKHIYEFMMKYGFDSDGRLFFAVTREGRPLRKRRYLFTELFAIIACAEYAKATGDTVALQRAVDTYRLVVDHIQNPEKLDPKYYRETYQAKAHNIPMIMLATTQELREVAKPDALYQKIADSAVDDILNHFTKPDAHAVFETIGMNNERLDSVEGRRITPGHALESAWFVMHEGMSRQDDDMIQRATQMIDFSMEIGWDKEYGGLLYFVDVEGKPSTQLEWDMKLWWTHNEALYALLLAYHLTGEQRYETWFEQVHEWAFAHFPNSEYGGWYGYLHRDGSLSTPLIGGMWKGFFHVPRALWLCWQLLGKMQKS
jgi:N-acylglucosamine 2-epimerase